MKPASILRMRSGVQPGYYRYARIYITEVQSGGATVAAVGRLNLIAWDGAKMFDATAAGGGTASASSENSGGSYQASNAFLTSGIVAGDSGFIWASNVAPGTTPQWLLYDFGAGNEKKIIGCFIQARGNASFIGQSPKTFILQVSNDGSSWTDIATPAAQTGWGVQEMRRFMVSSLPSYSGSPWGAHRYWQWVGYLSGGGQSIAELEHHTTSGGADQTGSSTPTASNTLAGFPVGQAIDNNSATIWSANGGAGDLQNIVLDFGSAIAFNEMVLQARNDGFPNFTPVTSAYRWADSSSGPWHTAVMLSGVTWTGGQSRTVSDPLFI